MRRILLALFAFVVGVGFSVGASAAPLPSLDIYQVGYTDYGGGLVAFDVWVDTGTGDPGTVPSAIELHLTAGGGGTIAHQLAFGSLAVNSEQDAFTGSCSFDPGCDPALDTWYALDGSGTDIWAGFVGLPVNTTVCPGCTGSGFAEQGDGSLYMGMSQGGGNSAPANLFRLGQIVVQGGDGTLDIQGRVIQAADFSYSSWVISTPEPGTALLMGAGLIGLAIRRRRA